MIDSKSNRWIVSVLLGASAACGSEQGSATPARLTPDASQAKPAPQPTIASLTWIIPSGGEFGVSGDGLAAYTDASGDTRYKDQECVYAATMFMEGSGDAVMQNSAPSYEPKTCGGVYPRQVVFTLFTADPVTGALTPSGSAYANPAYLIVLAVHNPGHVMPVGGAWELHDAGPNDGGRCGRLAFRTYLEGGTPVGGDQLMVRRLAADTWEVESQPNTIDDSGNVVRHDRAWCSNENGLYDAPVHYVIKSATALPTS